MRVVYNSILPIGKNKVAMTLYPFIFVKRNHAALFTPKVLNRDAMLIDRNINKSQYIYKK